MDDDWGYPYFRNPQIKFNCEKMLGVKQELLGTSRGFDHENHPKNQAGSGQLLQFADPHTYEIH